MAICSDSASAAEKILKASEFNTTKRRKNLSGLAREMHKMSIDFWKRKEHIGAFSCLPETLRSVRTSDSPLSQE